MTFLTSNGPVNLCSNVRESTWMGRVAEWPAKPSVPVYILELEADCMLVWGVEAGGQAGWGNDSFADCLWADCRPPKGQQSVWQRGVWEEEWSRPFFRVCQWRTIRTFSASPNIIRNVYFFFVKKEIKIIVLFTLNYIHLMVLFQMYCSVVFGRVFFLI